MHLIFERSKGGPKSNCNILSLAWAPYYDESKFRLALFKYHQKQLLELTSSVAGSGSLQAQLESFNQRTRSRRPRTQSVTRNGHGSESVNFRESRQLPSQINNKPNQFLNSRLAEFSQRYIYLKDHRDNGENSKGSSNSTALAISDELDSSYGRIPAFGWLVIGNIGKIVGVTLTSLVYPSIEEASKELSSYDYDNEDLMLFREVNDTVVSDINSSSDNQINSGIQISTTGLTGPEVETSLNNLNRPDRSSARTNYNLRGHLDEIILVKWNELYQKLATVDSKGNVLIWGKVNEKFTINTPFYNRTKSVADFKWSNNGKTALICYTDSFILVGSSSGQRHWHSMLNLDEYHITCASWTPNDDQLLFGVSNGNVVVIDLPHSELTELTVNQTNIRTMCWSTCEMRLKNLTISETSSLNTIERPSRNTERRSSTVVNQRRLSRDCSVFSRYRFCSQGPSGISGRCNGTGNGQLGIITSNQVNDSGISKLSECKQRNILAIDFANSTIKLYDGGLDDPEPKTIQVYQESYTMHWSSDGKILAVAGFNIQTTAPSVGYLRCRYLNAIKFYDHSGYLIYEHLMKHNRYPITAFTWAHDDNRLFVATGPRLHCAKVFFGIPPLSLLTISCIQRFTKISDKNDILKSIVENNLKSRNIIEWQSNDCPINLRASSNRRDKSKQLYSDDSSGSAMDAIICNNSNVYSYHLPFKLQTKIDELFNHTIVQPFDEHWTPSDIIWHVPRHERRYFCTLICYTSEQDINYSGHQYRANTFRERSIDINNTSEQNKIFVLYIESQGSLIPILRARKVGFLKPEFVIFDPDESQQVSSKPRKISDISQRFHIEHIVQSKNSGFERLYQDRIASSQRIPHSPKYYLEDVESTHNCLSLHQNFTSDCTSHASSIERQSISDAEHYYNFDEYECKDETKLRDRFLQKSNRKENTVMSMSSNPYLLYNMSIGSPSISYKINTSSLINQNNFSKSIHSCSRHPETQLRLKAKGLNNRANLTEAKELVRIKSNIWGTKFKVVNYGNRMIKQRFIMASVVYKASILHLQPRQIFLNIMDMSNYCCLCSKHHHSKIRKQTQCHPMNSNSLVSDGPSILDAPNIHSFVNSPKFRSRAKSGYSMHNGESTDESKIALSVGDAIKIAPKLEGNQAYSFSNDQNYLRASTSRYIQSKRSRDSSLDSEKRRRQPQDLYPKNSKGIPPRPSTSRHHRLTNNINSYGLASQRSENLSSNPSPIQHQRSRIDHLHYSMSSKRNQDDILTLSLGQGDMVRVEMSSLDYKTIDESLVDEKSIRGQAKLDDFLSSNRTLKSIKAITEMIVDLSSKAKDSDEEKFNPGSLNLLENSNDQVNYQPLSSKDLIVPQAPVHQPKRIPPAQFCNGLQTSQLSIHRGSHSASSSPLKQRSRTSKSLNNDSRAIRTRLDEHIQATKSAISPQPETQTASLAQRLSLTAKRLVDGPMRSIYGGYSFSDLSADDGEPLMVCNARKIRKSKGYLLNQRSQPCTPKKTSTGSRQLDNFRAQIIQKLQVSGLIGSRTKSSLTEKSIRSNGNNSHDRKMNLSSPRSPTASSDSDYGDSELSDTSSDEVLPKLSKSTKISRSLSELRDLKNIKSKMKLIDKNSKTYMKPDIRQVERKSMCSNINCCCGKEFKLNNRPPVWNESSQVYQLDFGGRVTQESAKNLQIDCEGKLALQFGRIDRCTYTLDYKYPFNAVQAMAIALASLTQRLK